MAKRPHKIRIKRNKNKKFDIEISKGSNILYISKQQYERKSTCKKVLYNLLGAIQEGNYTFIEDK